MPRLPDALRKLSHPNESVQHLPGLDGAEAEINAINSTCHIFNNKTGENGKGSCYVDLENVNQSNIYTTKGELSSKCEEFLAEWSQFDSDHGVNFSAPTCCQSATFVQPLFAFHCPLFFYEEKNNNNAALHFMPRA